jgi:murein DD-endopeptidase
MRLIMTARLALTPVLFALAGMLLVACAGSPGGRGDGRGDPRAEAAARTAVKMVGTPYRFGGHIPSDGFDCSGLVHYSYQKVGMPVPRTTKTQRSRSRLVSNRDKGDLLFFNQDGRRASHVGIYIGDGDFVHAPSSGKHVRTDSLSDPYWKNHLLEVRRFEAAALENDRRAGRPWPLRRWKRPGSGRAEAGARG